MTARDPHAHWVVRYRTAHGERDFLVREGETPPVGPEAELVGSVRFTAQDTAGLECGARMAVDALARRLLPRPAALVLVAAE